jgi:cell wall-associated NlpC family hydrolase
VPILLLVLLVVFPLGLLVVFSDSLSTYQPVQPTPQVIVQALPTPRVAPTTTPRLAPAVSAPGGDVIEVARRWLGVRYQWGGCTMNGVDCSCMVQNVLRVLGISAPRTTKPQFAWGSPVDRGDLQAGDLVFFNDTCTGCGPNPTHVALSIGGEAVIHCGDPCQVATISSFGSKYAGARRPPW